MLDTTIDPVILEPLMQAGIIHDHTYTPVAPIRWGKDHISTILYLEARSVDASGNIAIAHMRSDPALHPQFCHPHIITDSVPNAYPTIAKDGEKIDNHDDWYCLADIVLAGLAVYSVGGSSKGGKIALTDLGWTWAGKARRNRAEGKRDSDFDPAALGLI